jgi:hypothetical protein
MLIRYVKINGKQHVNREEQMNTILTDVVLVCGRGRWTQSHARFNTESIVRFVLSMKILIRGRFCERN